MKTLKLLSFCLLLALHLHAEDLGSLLAKNAKERLLPALQHASNSTLLTKEEAQAVFTLIQTGLPISPIHPIQVDATRYTDSQGVPALTESGSLLDNAYLAPCDARVVWDKQSGKYIMQFDIRWWTQYTQAGKQLPNSLLPHLFHEVLRYAKAIKVIERDDNDSKISGNLKTPYPDSILGNSAPYQSYLNYKSVPIAEQLYVGEMSCWIAGLDADESDVGVLHFAKKLDYRSCYVEVHFGPNEGTQEAPKGKARYEIYLTEDNQLLSAHEDVTYTQQKSEIQLIQGTNIRKMRLSDNMEILDFSHTYDHYYRIDRSAPSVAGTSYGAEMFCDFVTSVVGQYPGFMNTAPGYAARNGDICKATLTFNEDGTFRYHYINLSNNKEYDDIPGRYRQYGYNIYFFDKKVKRASYSWLARDRMGNEIVSGQGERLFKDVKVPQGAFLTPYGVYEGVTSCEGGIRPYKKLEKDTGCIVTIHMNYPYAGYVWYSVRTADSNTVLDSYQGTYSLKQDILLIWTPKDRRPNPFRVEQGYLFDGGGAVLHQRR